MQGRGSLVPRPYARAGERVWLQKSKSLDPLQNSKASNEIAKLHLLECGSKRIMYVLPCESSSFTILWLSACWVLSGPFVTAGCQDYISLTPTVLVVVVGAVYFLKAKSP